MTKGIGIEKGVVGERQDGPCLGNHHDGYSRSGFVLDHRGGEGLLDDVLDMAIDG